jgi:HTH-type transcriptional regulator/antitoxin HipB
LLTIGQLKPILVAARKQRGLTQADVAQRLGISQQTYARMEGKLSSVSVGRIMMLCHILGLQIQFLDVSNRQMAADPHDSDQAVAEW